MRVDAPVPPYATESVELAESMPDVSWARPVPIPVTASVPPLSWRPFANVLVAAVPVMLRYVDWSPAANVDVAVVEVATM